MITHIHVSWLAGTMPTAGVQEGLVTSNETVLRQEPDNNIIRLIMLHIIIVVIVIIIIIISTAMIRSVHDSGPGGQRAWQGTRGQAGSWRVLRGTKAGSRRVGSRPLKECHARMSRPPRETFTFRGGDPDVLRVWGPRLAALDRKYRGWGLQVRPISLLRLSLLRFVDFNFPGSSLWT